MPASHGQAVTLRRVLHPCVLLQRGGIRVLVDPCFGTFTRRVLTSRVMGVALPPPGMQPEELHGLTAIAVTHHHEDHFDEAAVARLPGRSARILAAGRGVARRARRLGFGSVERLRPWESAGGEGWSITAVPARSPNAPGEVSFVVDLGGYRVFHGGDTARHGAFPEIGRRLRPHAAILPVNGVTLLGMRLTMTPRQACRAAKELAVEIAVPVHDEMAFHGLSGWLYRAPGGAEAFQRAVAREHPALRVLRPARGETVTLGAP